ncbi:hypothetical protein IWX50DRAFT_196269 [Phyllosticta citricarpa]
MPNRHASTSACFELQSESGEERTSTMQCYHRDEFPRLRFDGTDSKIQYDMRRRKSKTDKRNRNDRLVAPSEVIQTNNCRIENHQSKFCISATTITQSNVQRHTKRNSRVSCWEKETNLNLKFLHADESPLSLSKNRRPTSCFTTYSKLRQHDEGDEREEAKRKGARAFRRLCAREEGLNSWPQSDAANVAAERCRGKSGRCQKNGWTRRDVSCRHRSRVIWRCRWTGNDQGCTGAQYAGIPVCLNRASTDTCRQWQAERHRPYGSGNGGVACRVTRKSRRTSKRRRRVYEGCCRQTRRGIERAQDARRCRIHLGLA